MRAQPERVERTCGPASCARRVSSIRALTHLLLPSPGSIGLRRPSPGSIGLRRASRCQSWRCVLASYIAAACIRIGGDLDSSVRASRTPPLPLRWEVPTSIDPSQSGSRHGSARCWPGEVRVLRAGEPAYREARLRGWVSRSVGWCREVSLCASPRGGQRAVGWGRVL